MKKQAILPLIIIVSVLGWAGAISAQSTVGAEASASAEADSGGGLGQGLRNMVRGILGDDDASFVPPAAPEASLMMQANPTLEAPAPTRMMMQAKTTAAEDMSTMSVEALTAAELSAYTRELMREDNKIQSIETADTHVRITYAQPAKVLKFVSVVMKITVSTYIDGRVEVSYPWYAFAASKHSAELKAAVSNRVQPMTSVEATESFSLETQRALVDAMHVVLATEFSSSTGGDQ